MNQNDKRSQRWLPFILFLLVFVWSVFTWWNRSLPPPTSRIQAAEVAITEAGGVTTLAQGMAGIETQIGWQYNAGELPPRSPVIVGEWVYLTAGTRRETGRVIALNLHSGQLRWEKALDGVALQAPMVAGNMLFIGVSQGKVLALDRYSGETRWAVPIGVPLSGQLALTAGVLFVGADGIRAFDAATGQQRWHQQSESRITQSVLYGDGVIAAVDGSRLYLLDSWNGQQRLVFPLWFNPTGGLAISGQTVAVTGDRANVQALQLHGRNRFLEPTLRFWRTRLWLYGIGPAPSLPISYAWQKRTLNALSASMAGADDQRFFLTLVEPGRTGRLVALDSQQGEVLWEQHFSASLAPGATLLGQVVVFGIQDGRVVALRRDSGQTVWATTLAEPLLAAPVFGGNLMVVTLASGSVQAIRLDSGPGSR